MKKNQNAKKEITRDVFIKIPLSKEEKALWIKYAEDIKINPTRLARNLLMIESESLINKYGLIPVMKSYVKYLELTKNKEALERLNQE